MKQPTRLIVNLLILLIFSMNWGWGSVLSMACAGVAKTESVEQKIDQMGKYDSFILEGDIRRFAGETLTYDLGFMIFSNAGQAQISFYEENGQFKCILVAETKGFIGWLTSYVKHIYKASFYIVDGGKKLRTATFEREIIVGNERERIFHAMDYASLRHHWFVYQNDELIGQFNEPLSENAQLDDVLGAFYNFRNAAYGKIETGRSYHIPTFWTKDNQPEKGSEMFIYLPTESERRNYEEAEGAGKMEGSQRLMKVQVPSDLFETENGELYFWASKHLIPLEAIYKDFILFGDLRFRLSKGTIHRRK